MRSSKPSNPDTLSPVRLLSHITTEPGFNITVESQEYSYNVVLNIGVAPSIFTYSDLSALKLSIRTVTLLIPADFTGTSNAQCPSASVTVSYTLLPLFSFVSGVSVSVSESPPLPVVLVIEAELTSFPKYSL